MASATIYHNPRCSKSRQTLELLRTNNISPEVVEYLNEPPSVDTLKSILDRLGMEPAQLIRQKEFKSLGLPQTDDAETLLELMSRNPAIIERPIVIVGNQARIGRPPETVLEILPS